MEATAVNAASNRRSPKRYYITGTKMSGMEKRIARCQQSGDAGGRKDSKPPVNAEAARNTNEY